MNYLYHRESNSVDMSEDDEQQYMRVPKEHAEAVMSKLANAGLIDDDAEVRWEGDFVSFPLKAALPTKDD
jgi:tRNA G37 N-methylase Trm5